ncbi:hypothetical protein DSO57_1006941 [Entomophthora muscae]|uniref:Uncharacterized protein n=1 Tax=Entomophthora muscae TaxID=34485 RepID=A0ACC2SWR4_9FUNG|nr:hypothetical protein DSO57_1006941 [Entomophthora muscae]
MVGVIFLSTHSGQEPLPALAVLDNLLDRAWNLLSTGEHLVKSLPSDNPEIPLSQLVSESSSPGVALAPVLLFMEDPPSPQELLLSPAVSTGCTP